MTVTVMLHASIWQMDFAVFAILVSLEMEEIANVSLYSLASSPGPFLAFLNQCCTLTVSGVATSGPTMAGHRPW